ncbi:MAG: hypothetical protein ACQEQY_08245 [Halobacteriota archaeon]
MNETVWPDLGGEKLQYSERTWELTGTVVVENDGRTLAVDAAVADGSGDDTGTFYFTLQDPPQSLNPGNLGDHFDRIERTKRNQYLVVETAGPTYRYRLSRLEFD